MRNRAAEFRSDPCGNHVIIRFFTSEDRIEFGHEPLGAVAQVSRSLPDGVIKGIGQAMRRIARGRPASSASVGVENVHQPRAEAEAAKE
jgi:hypothetical protein